MVNTFNLINIFIENKKNIECVIVAHFTIYISNGRITTEEDTDGIYDMIKKFLTQYNELINEMDKLYNAESAKGYEPLTDEELIKTTTKKVKRNYNK